MIRSVQASDRELAIVLVAGEESGDQLGAALMRALKEHTGGSVRFAGRRRTRNAVEGLASLFAIDDLAIIGFAAISAATAGHPAAYSRHRPICGGHAT